jgi:hypothetical protein
VTIYFAILLFISTQYFSILLDMVKPLNESRPRKVLFPAEYFIDQQKYFHIIAIHISTATLLLINILIATESFCLSSALHAFGLFKVARYENHNHVFHQSIFLFFILLFILAFLLNLIVNVSSELKFDFFCLQNYIVNLLVIMINFY